MNSVYRFRIALVLLAVITGSYAFASMLVEMNSSDPPPFPSDPAGIAARATGILPGWARAISPFRTDLECNNALTIALQALGTGKQAPAAEQVALNTRAQSAVRQTLAVAPSHSELWLALALLQAQRDPKDPALVEALKMSYFTAPSDPKLMPLRLDTATLFDALSDPDLKELARGDLRLMLTRQEDLKIAVVSAYRRASSLGKAFLNDAVQLIGPAFIPTLHGQKPI